MTPVGIFIAEIGGGKDIEDPCGGSVGVIIDPNADCDTSKEDLKKVFPGTSDEKLQKIADAINKYGKDYGINTKEKLQHFLAQAGHESNDFKSFEEILNYRVKKLGISYWRRRFNPHTSYTTPPTTPINPKKKNPNDYKSTSSTTFVNNEKFANFVYCCRMGNGDEDSGDGYKYKGRGIFQLTGKYNYTQFNAYYQSNIDANVNLVSNPDLVASNMKIAVISALWYYQNKVIEKLSINSKTTVFDVTRKVNGGKKGLPEREALFEDCKEQIKCL